MLLALLCLLALPGCVLQPRQRIGTGIPVDLLIFFHEGTTHDEYKTFIAEVLRVPHPSGNGTLLREGVVEIFSTDMATFPALGLNFDSWAPRAVREEVTADIRAHRFVYRVFEDIAPGDVTEAMLRE